MAGGAGSGGALGIDRPAGGGRAGGGGRPPCRLLLPGAGQLFVTGITNEQNKAPYPPQAAIFAKGSEAEKLIIVALEDGRIDTIFRARAIFAQMTAVARLLPVFSQLGVEDYFTFFDLAKMLGFQQITISNGRDFAHQILIK